MAVQFDPAALIGASPFILLGSESRGVTVRVAIEGADFPLSEIEERIVGLEVQLSTALVSLHKDGELARFVEEHDEKRAKAFPAYQPEPDWRLLSNIETDLRVKSAYEQSGRAPLGSIFADPAGVAPPPSTAPAVVIDDWGAEVSGPRGALRIDPFLAIESVSRGVVVRLPYVQSSAVEDMLDVARSMYGRMDQRLAASALLRETKDAVLKPLFESRGQTVFADDWKLLDIRQALALPAQRAPVELYGWIDDGSGTGVDETEALS